MLNHNKGFYSYGKAKRVGTIREGTSTRCVGFFTVMDIQVKLTARDKIGFRANGVIHVIITASPMLINCAKLSDAICLASILEDGTAFILPPEVGLSSAQVNFIPTRVFGNG